MIRLLMFLTILSISACSSLKPVELAPEQLQQQISNGQIVEVGDRIKVVTSDGQHHEFRVTAITDTSIEGSDTAVPIDQVVALESRRFSGGKTALLAGGTILFYQILAAIAAIAVLGG